MTVGHSVAGRPSFQAPQEDPTERAMFDAFLVETAFRDAILAAGTRARIMQIKERLAALITAFQRVEEQAILKAESLGRK